MLSSRSGISAGAISMHRIFTHMYSTVPIGPSYIESLTGFRMSLPLQQCLPTSHHRTSSFCSFIGPNLGASIPESKTSFQNYIHYDGSVSVPSILRT